MNDRVRTNYSVRVDLLGFEDDPRFTDGILVCPRYDHIQVFNWLGSAILRCLLDEGMAHILMSEATGRYVHERTGIPLVEVDFIVDEDYEMYLRAQTKTLDDSWLSDPDELPGGGLHDPS